MPDVLELLNCLLYAGVGVWALRSWMRDRDRRAAGWIALAMFALAMPTAMGLIAPGVSEHSTTVGSVLRRISILDILIIAWSLHRFATELVPRPKIERRIVDAITLALVVWTLLLPTIPTADQEPPTGFGWYVLAFALHWCGTLLLGCVELWTGGRHRASITRSRMRLLAIAAASLAVALLVLAVVGDTLGREVQLLSTFAALSFVIAWNPPAIVRVIWRRRDMEELRRATVELVGASTPDDVVTTILPSMIAVIGAEGAAMLSVEGVLIHSIGIEHDAARAAIDGVREVDATEEPILLDHGRQIVGFWGGSWVVVQFGGSDFVPGREEISLARSIGWSAGTAAERIRRGEMAVERQRQLAAAQQLAQLGSFENDLVSGVVTWSSTMYDLLALEQRSGFESVGEFAEYVPEPERTELFRRFHEAVESIGSFSMDHPVIRADGERRVFHTRGEVTSRDGAGTPLRVAGVIHDVTTRRETERALRAALDHERRSLQRMRGLDDVKNGILSAVSHELRTPLTSVAGIAATLDDLDDELEPATRRELIQTLRSETGRLEDLCTDLLDVERLRHGFGAIDPEAMQLDEVVRAELQRIGAHTIVTRLESIEVVADRRRFERVVDNLVSNARKYAGEDPRIVVTVRSSMLRDIAAVELLVEDDGPGVPEELRDRVFEPFHRGGARLGHQPGTGIGLTIVGDTAMLHGGRAWVERSEELGGASFHVVIPVDPALIVS